MKRALHHGRIKIFVVLLLVFFGAQSVSATTVIIPADDDMIMSARAIVTGKVLSISCGFDERHDRVYTFVTIKIRHVLKGQITERKIILKQLGGTVGDQTTVIFGSPRFSVGEKCLLYLDTWADGSLRVHQMFLGKFNIVMDAVTGKQTVVRSSPDEQTALLQIQPHDGLRSGPSTERMELSAYLDMVRTRLATNIVRSDEFEAQYYADVPMLARPPAYDAAAARGGLEPQFALLGSPPSRFFEPDTGQPVIAMVKPDGAPAASTVTDMVSAMNAWSNVAGCSLTVVSGGTLSTCYNTAGISGIGIVFDNCDGVNSPSTGCSGTLAWGGYSIVSSQSKTVNGTLFRRTMQGFVSFNPWASCWFSNPCNVQEIATHEIGHALGLGHSSISSATMAAIAHFDGRCASIMPDDAAGISFIYPAAGGGGMAISTASPLPNGTVSVAYSQTLSVGGGTAPYTWSLAAGSGPLPTGLNLSSGGVISGTPTAQGTFNFNVQVTDSTPQQAQKAFSITVVTAGTPPYDSQFVSQNVPTNVQAGQQFSVNMKWKNTGSVTWSGGNFFIVTQNPAFNTTWGGSSGANAVSLSAFTIGPGQQLNLTFNATAPATPGNYNFQWQVYQQSGVSFFGEPSTNVVVAVGSTPVSVVTQSPLASGTVATPYGQTLTAAGGTGTYTWSLAAGSGPLPGGLGLSSGGVISGTPTTPGTFNFTVQVNDSASGSAQKPFSITINPAPTPVSITTSSLPGGIVGTPYSQSVAATGGTGVYSWTLASGSGPLPGGLSLSPGGLISGTPTVGGTFNFTVRAADSASGSAQKALAITVTVVKVAPSIQGPLAIEATKGVPFLVQMTATGGTPPYAWVIMSGSLPSGLSLNAAGVISGTPTSMGSSSFVLQLTDAELAKDQKSVTLQVNPPPLIIDDPAIPFMEVGAPLSIQVTAEGGLPPYVWSLSAGSLPPGVSLNPTTGIIAGMPLVPGNYAPTLRVTDAQSHTAFRQVSIPITPGPLRIATVALSFGVTGTEYSQSLSAAGGAPPYVWMLTSGSLPNGVSLNPATGTLSGSPTVAGRFSFTVAVKDQLLTALEGAFEILIVTPDDVPHITAAKLKGSGKLIVNGEHFDKQGVVLIDGVATPTTKMKPGKAVINPALLAQGDHEIRVVSSDGISSNTFILNVK
jgi:Putative Ig domain/Matrixin/Ig-like domain from next to BRCA1 gene